VAIQHRLNDRARLFIEQLQDHICPTLETADGKQRFHEDSWQHNKCGSGKTRVLQSGAVFEKAGVNCSAISSMLTETLAGLMNVSSQQVLATGISVALHPFSPMIPTAHMNLRYLELENGDAWFGGGTDLTSWYFFEEDAAHFHKTLKASCDRHDISFYPRFKQWCDEYFFIKHRRETRGIGGIFFDYLRGDLERLFTFVQQTGDAFMDGYFPIVERRRAEPWSEREKTWQLIRRGRYVEFNLMYDRGTLFGLETGGRTESILMSLPPEVKWVYDDKEEPGSRESILLEVLRNPRQWT